MGRSRQALITMSRDELQAHQLQRLNDLLMAVVPGNPFYARKFTATNLPLPSLEAIHTLPLTDKAELIAAANGHVPNNRTFALEHYRRLHRTSGTSGHPLSIMDTQDDWKWWIATWQYVLDAADVTANDRACMAFSFGPFIGFWSAYDALVDRDVMVIPAGGLSTPGRLALILDTEATVVCCTPTYALRMAEVAEQTGIDLPASSVRMLIVAGEPGGSLPSVRNRLSAAWGARIIDHAGATEVGPWGFGDQDGNVLHVIESEFIAEFREANGTMLDATAAATAHRRQPMELVLTALGRVGMPAIRYRTGDLVIPSLSRNKKCRFVTLQGGILGRADDMVVIRGVNVFPSSIETILREFDDVAEFRLTATRPAELDQLELELEGPGQERLDEIARTIHSRLGLRMELTQVPAGTLPRFEAKSMRFVDARSSASH